MGTNSWELFRYDGGQGQSVNCISRRNKKCRSNRTRPHDVPSLKHYNLFGNETFINNIALLELVYEVTLTEYILPTQLPRSGSILQPRTEGTVLGFKDNYLHFGNVVSLCESECLAGGIEENLKYNLTFCTNNLQGDTVPCNDDLGSAIFSRNEDGSYTQTGILISGGCYEKPSVFTRTEIYLPIIREITGIYLPRN